MILEIKHSEHNYESKPVTQSTEYDDKNFQVINLDETGLASHNQPETNKSVNHQVIVIDSMEVESCDQGTTSTIKKSKEDLKLREKEQKYMDKIVYNPSSSQMYLPLAEFIEVSHNVFSW